MWYVCILSKIEYSVADPGFPRRGSQPWILGKNYYLTRFLQKTAWKWKKLDREGGGAPHLGSANGINLLKLIKVETPFGNQMNRNINTYLFVTYAIHFMGIFQPQQTILLRKWFHRG